MQASFGQSTLGITSFFTYVGLGLGFLGSSLALPFGLYVLICQRTSEKYVQVLALRMLIVDLHVSHVAWASPAAVHHVYLSHAGDNDRPGRRCAQNGQ